MYMIMVVFLEYPDHADDAYHTFLPLLYSSSPKTRKKSSVHRDALSMKFKVPPS